MNNILNARHLLKYLGKAPLTWYVRSLGTTSALLSTEGTSKQEDVKGESAASQEAPAEEEEEQYADAAEGEEQLRNEILDAALPFVHSFGWSQDALAQGAESLGYSAMAHGMFPNGAVALVNHFYSTCNERLRDLLEEEVNLAKESESKRGTTAFIAYAVEERLRMNVEYIDIWHKALALHASPFNVPRALDNLTTITDHIWFHAGDRSTDFNWYTKRGLLAAVYKSSEIYMLQDKSDDFQETWAFMNRRLSDVHSVGKCARNAGSLAENFKDVSKAGFTTVLNILGLNSRTR